MAIKSSDRLMFVLNYGQRNAPGHIKSVNALTIKEERKNANYTLTLNT